VIAFGLAFAVTGVMVSTVQSVAVPRLLAPQGGLARGPVRFLAGLALGATAFAVLLVFLAPSVAALVAGRLGLDAQLLRDLIVISAGVIAVQVVVGELSSVAIVLGQRFVPAASAVLPSIAAMVGMLASPNVDVRTVYLLFLGGSLLQAALLGAIVVRPERLVAGNVPRMGAATLAMLGSYALLGFLTPAERVLAGFHSPADAAQYDYAIRSLRSVQQLILGGLVMASLGDWSAMATAGARQRLRQSLFSGVLLAAVLLVAASSVALVAAHPLVQWVFQRGNFTAHDSDVVVLALTVALPGFCAEGVTLVVGSALAGVRQNGTLATIGVLSFILRGALLAIFAPRWGAVGAAAAYSVAASLFLVGFVLLAARQSLWPEEIWNSLRRVTAVGAGTIVASALVLISRGVPASIGGALVAIVFLVLFVGLRPIPAFPSFSR